MGPPTLQDVRQVAAGFGEQVVALARAAHHVHHGHDVDGRQRYVGHRPHPRPHRRGGRPRSLRQPVDGFGTVRPDRRVPPTLAQLGRREQLRALGRARLVGDLAGRRVGGPLPRRVPLLFVLCGEDGQPALNLLAAGRLPAAETLVEPCDLHDRPASPRAAPTPTRAGRAPPLWKSAIRGPSGRAGWHHQIWPPVAAHVL